MALRRRAIARRREVVAQTQERPQRKGKDYPFQSLTAEVGERNRGRVVEKAGPGLITVLFVCGERAREGKPTNIARRRANGTTILGGEKKEMVPTL
jgi:hypothetical protein